jgi:hypothetical protein
MCNNRVLPGVTNQGTRVSGSSWSSIENFMPIFL